LMPFNMGGLYSGLKPTRTPGAGKRNSCAWAKGRGPKVLIKKDRIKIPDKNIRE